MAKGYNSRKKRVKKNVPEGIATISSTFNNTIVTISDLEGNALCWASAGTLGIKGSKKSTPYAASKSAEVAASKAREMGVKKVKVVVKGLGSGREAAIKAIQASGIEVTTISDNTPVPHNGCRPPKQRH